MGTELAVGLAPVEQIVFRPFQAGDEAAFRDLNAAWIKAYFVMEEKDWEVLNDPVKYVLNPGGAILMAVEGGRAVGCCALLPMEGGCYEVAKMTVVEEHRGRGLGRQLLQHVIEYGQSLGAKRLYLETNNKLRNAVHLYESLGFRHLPPERVKPSPYARSNVQMELTFG